MFADTEYRVSWHWRDGDDPYPIRRRVFKTRSGAERLAAKLTSNGGRYDKMDDGVGIQTGELIVTHLRLGSLTIEERMVGPWAPTTPTA